MSPLDGFELLDSLGGHPPTILMSSFSPPSIENKAIANGAVGFLRKPFRPDDLMGLLEAIESELRSGGQQR
jgi:CheY-like chemotaxis protein